MARCDVCRNNYEPAFTVQSAQGDDMFDAVHAHAARCAHCRCPVTGHGVGRGGRIHGCAHCAGHAGGHA